MNFSETAIVCAARPHGETAVIAKLMTARHGMVGAYVAGGRGRHLRPLLIPGNEVAAEVRAKSEGRLPFARLELVRSRGPWMSEPLPAAALAWVTALAAAALPERHAYPALHSALAALIEAICVAPSARRWAGPLLSYETLLLRELGYGGGSAPPAEGAWADYLGAFDKLGRQLERYALAERRSDVMAARAMLRERLARIEGG
ncbi:DNA recombination protein RecO [Novosphingobium sp. PC22D]|uniref:DNA repair protein RecO n=1 Tax=Novosphingobium sp. PC22D TaxID=1962403 RepID=UPI000BF0B0FD|nr:recombination protein O N-terminal domain-containing protein [Novosphingobium sp. PC22D]PEQ13730.1 DNA recombination protein RecO [Novosphingobium sp. PC22D]